VLVSLASVPGVPSLDTLLAHAEAHSLTDEQADSLAHTLLREEEEDDHDDEDEEDEDAEPAADDAAAGEAAVADEQHAEHEGAVVRRKRKQSSDLHLADALLNAMPTPYPHLLALRADATFAAYYDRAWREWERGAQSAAGNSSSSSSSAALITSFATGICKEIFVLGRQLRDSKDQERMLRRAMESARDRLEAGLLGLEAGDEDFSAAEDDDEDDDDELQHLHDEADADAACASTRSRSHSHSPQEIGGASSTCSSSSSSQPQPSHSHAHAHSAQCHCSNRDDGVSVSPPLPAKPVRGAGAEPRPVALAH